MKKIGIIAFGGSNIGGVYQYIQSIIDALKEDKNSTYVIFCEINDNRFDDYNLEIRKTKKNKINFSRKIIRQFQHLFFIRKSWFFDSKEIQLFEDIDVFISPATSLYPHFYLNKPYLATVHDLQERYYPYNFSIYSRLSRWLNGRTITNSAQKIICESKFVKNDIVKFFKIQSPKICIIQSPPPEEFLNHKFDNKKFNLIKVKFNLPDFYLFYPANSWPHKNHIKLIEALSILSKEFKNINLVLTGSKKNNYSKVLIRAKELGIQKQIIHLGYIDYEDLPYIYKMSQMLVMPSLFESVSIPIYEAFALKVPVCSSNAVALPEQVGKGGIVFNPNNANDIAEKIKLYLFDRQMGLNKAELGYKNLKDFNHKSYKSKLTEVIKHIN